MVWKINTGYRALQEDVVTHDSSLPGAYCAAKFSAKYHLPRQIERVAQLGVLRDYIQPQLLHVARVANGHERVEVGGGGGAPAEVGGEGVQGGRGGEGAREVAWCGPLIDLISPSFPQAGNCHSHALSDHSARLRIVSAPGIGFSASKSLKDATKRMKNCQYRVDGSSGGKVISLGPSIKRLRPSEGLEALAKKIDSRLLCNNKLAIWA
ncbi:hypothetical protein DFH09DRAFT_1079217 [Mycena vulgaris]|nr:hypothetical protein DFH09DRAFT_1079217 [Mycena vulgaris]